MFGLCGLLLTACFADEAPSVAPNTNSPVATKPPELPVYGEPGPGKIRVKVTGQVKYPGIYFLKDGAVIRDVAVMATKEMSDPYWLPLCRLRRPAVDLTDEVILLHEEDVTKPLKDGDWLILRHDIVF